MVQKDRPGGIRETLACYNAGNVCSKSRKAKRYALSVLRYAQRLKPSSSRSIARFNMANCLRENVNEGEDNAQYKAFHCSLMRCQGPGACADPMMCSTTLFLGKDGKHRFRPAWLAREAAIKTLARRGQAKKQTARRLETLQDTTLCKSIVLSAETLCQYKAKHELAFRIQHPTDPSDQVSPKSLHRKPRLLEYCNVMSANCFDIISASCKRMRSLEAPAFTDTQSGRCTIF